MKGTIFKKQAVKKIYILSILAKQKDKNLI